MSGQRSLYLGSPIWVADNGSSARSSSQVVSKSLTSGAFAALAAKAVSTVKNPRGASSRASVVRRIGAGFSATDAGSGKGLAAHMAHGGPKSQQLHLFEVRIAGNQLYVGVVQE